MKEILRIEAAVPSTLTPEEIDRAYQLVIDAYAETEVDIWGAHYQRLPKDEYLSLLAREEVLIARMETQIVGILWVHRLNAHDFGFGLLAADPQHKGLGIGRALIQQAEEKARSEGATRMVLEILRPRDFEVPFKTLLAEWYLRLGYRYVESMSFLELRSEKVEKAKLLKVPAVFDVYVKALT